MDRSCPRSHVRYLTKIQRRRADRRGAGAARAAVVRADGRGVSPDGWRHHRGRTDCLRPLQRGGSTSAAGFTMRFPITARASVPSTMSRPQFGCFSALASNGTPSSISTSTMATARRSSSKAIRAFTRCRCTSSTTTRCGSLEVRATSVWPTASMMRRIFESSQRALPDVIAHRPGCVFYLAGADPYEDDQLGGLRLTKDGLRQRDRMVIEAVCDAQVPLVVVLAGGYARNVEDTVAIHCATVEEVLQHSLAEAFELLSSFQRQDSSVSAYAVFKSTISPASSIARASPIVTDSVTMDSSSSGLRTEPAGGARKSDDVKEDELLVAESWSRDRVRALVRDDAARGRFPPRIPAAPRLRRSLPPRRAPPEIPRFRDRAARGTAGSARARPSVSAGNQHDGGRMADDFDAMRPAVRKRPLGDFDRKHPSFKDDRHESAPGVLRARVRGRRAARW